jgi:hypothetical protein
MNAKIRFLVIGFFAASVCTPSTAQALQLEPGDIVVSALTPTFEPALFVVDPVTGNRAILSDNETGTGPDFGVPLGVAIEPDGDVIVADAAPASVFRVDPATGDRTILTGGSVGSGPNLIQPTGIAEVAGTIYVSDQSDFIMAVDPLTGNRTIFSGQIQSIGTGPPINQPQGLTAFGSSLLLANIGSPLMQIDRSSGNRVAFPGQDPSLSSQAPADVTVSGTGLIMMSIEAAAPHSSFISGVYAVNLQTDTYTLISGGSVGTGPQLSGPTGIATAANGTILLADVGLNAILSIDPTTGNRTILSDATHGSGSAFSDPHYMAVVPNVPEPSSIALLAIGAIGLAVMARFGRRCAIVSNPAL